MKREYLTVSNLLSFTRVLLVVPFLLVMLSAIPTARLWGCVILALAALTDKLDGYVARRFHQETEFGRILDPLADKVGVAAVAIILLILGSLPVWFVATLVVRDLLILAGGLYMKRRTGVAPPSSTAGKWAVGIVAVALMCALIDAPTVVTGVALAAATAMVVLSFVLYVRTFVLVVSGRGA
jgi:CDP-diacylglycerol--glycerol-3-phosphate 3-phosphatidyltransferase